MKKVIRLIILTVFIITASCLLNKVSADDPPEDPPQLPGGGDIPIGGGAPIGSGLVILLTLGAAYGAKKYYDIKKKRLLE